MFTSMGFNVVTVCLAIVQTCGFVEIPVVIPVRRCWSCSNGAATGLTQLGCVAANAREAGRPELKALEFYSGIGGLRMALEKAAETTGVNASVRSYEINDVANSVRRDERIVAARARTTAVCYVWRIKTESATTHRVSHGVDVFSSYLVRRVVASHTAVAVLPL